MRKAEYIEGVIQDFQRAVWGRPIVSIEEAAQLTGYSRKTIKDSIELGELVCSRRDAKSNIKITLRSLALWIVQNEKNSLPPP